MAQRVYLAIDIGASSGRHMAGSFDGRALKLTETYRFENGPTPVAGRLYWDLLAQWNHVRQGLRAARQAGLGEIASIGVDTGRHEDARHDFLVGSELPNHRRHP